MTTALMVFTDGRDDLLARTIESARENLVGEITQRFIHDDTANNDHAERLRRDYPDFLVLHSTMKRGFGGSYRYAWQFLARNTRDTEFVFGLEDDFTFNRPVDISAMGEVLRRNPDLVQLALRRQACNPNEELAGGVIEMHPEAYSEHQDHLGHTWLEHRLFWTTNPALYRRNLVRIGWPEGPQSEGHFGHKILRDYPEAMFGYWGPRDDTPWVHHIGEHRVGNGY